MTKFIKNPVEVDAFELIDNNDTAHYPEWFNELIEKGLYIYHTKDGIAINRGSDRLYVDVGDYLILTDQGDIIKSRPKIFLATYQICSD